MNIEQSQPDASLKQVLKYMLVWADIAAIDIVI